MYFPVFIIRLTLKNRYDISLTFLGEVLIFFSRREQVKSTKKLKLSQISLFSDP
jgi:hypothetical protein